MYCACALKDNVNAACTPEKNKNQIKNMHQTAKEKTNTINIYDLNQRDDGLA